MASREEKNALESLQRLIESDLAAMETEDLAAGVRDAELALDRAQEWSGRIVAELKARMSWSELVKLTGVPQTTLFRRAQPYLSVGPNARGD